MLNFKIFFLLILSLLLLFENVNISNIILTTELINKKVVSGFFPMKRSWVQAVPLLQSRYMGQSTSKGIHVPSGASNNLGLYGYHDPYTYTFLHLKKKKKAFFHYKKINAERKLKYYMTDKIFVIRSTKIVIGYPEYFLNKRNLFFMSICKLISKWCKK